MIQTLFCTLGSIHTEKGELPAGQATVTSTSREKSRSKSCSTPLDPFPLTPAAQAGNCSPEAVPALPSPREVQQCWSHRQHKPCHRAPFPHCSAPLTHPTHRAMGISDSAVSDHQLKSCCPTTAQALPRNGMGWNTYQGALQLWNTEVRMIHLWSWRAEYKLLVFHNCFSKSSRISWFVASPVFLEQLCSIHLQGFPFTISAAHLGITAELLGSCWKVTRFCGAGKHRWTLVLRMQKRAHVEKAETEEAAELFCWKIRGWWPGTTEEECKGQGHRIFAKHVEKWDSPWLHQ